MCVYHCRFNIPRILSQSSNHIDLIAGEKTTKLNSMAKSCVREGNTSDFDVKSVIKVNKGCSSNEVQNNKNMKHNSHSVQRENKETKAKKRKKECNAKEKNVQIESDDEKSNCAWEIWGDSSKVSESETNEWSAPRTRTTKNFKNSIDAEEESALANPYEILLSEDEEENKLCDNKGNLAITAPMERKESEKQLMM